MRILYSHRTKSADGQYVHIRELTDALRARGHELLMAGPDDGDGNRQLNAGDGRASIRDRLPGAVYEILEAGYSAAAYRRLAASARRLAPDILYERYNLYFHAGVWTKRKFDLPMLLEVNAPLVEERAAHGGLALKRAAAASEAAIWRAADAAFPVTGVLARHLIDRGVDEARITVIQNGVSDAFLAPPDSRDLAARYGLAGRLVLGFTGFVRDWHGADRILKFMKAHPRDDLHFLLVGDGPARSELETLAAALGLRDRFTCTGVVQRENIPAHVALFDVALQPAVVAYASPLKLFEYMGLGRAILAPRAENILEVLEPDAEALLFAEGDEGDFNIKLAALVDQAELRGKLGAAARARLLRDDFTWAGNAARVERIAERLLAEKYA